MWLAACVAIAATHDGPAKAGHDVRRSVPEVQDSARLRGGAEVGRFGGQGWPVNGGVDNIRYSPLTQINRDNVTQLRVAWTYDSRDAFTGSEMQSKYSKGFFAPPSFEGTIVFPGFDGGAEWGGAAFDPDGYPAITPPWGTLNAIDLNAGTIRSEDSVRRVSRACGEGDVEHRQR
jgi:glucose dehydrogenase